MIHNIHQPAFRDHFFLLLPWTSPCLMFLITSCSFTYFTELPLLELLWPVQDVVMFIYVFPLIRCFVSFEKTWGNIFALMTIWFSCCSIVLRSFIVSVVRVISLIRNVFFISEWMWGFVHKTILLFVHTNRFASFKSIIYTRHHTCVWSTLMNSTLRTDFRSHLLSPVRYPPDWKFRYTLMF